MSDEQRDIIAYRLEQMQKSLEAQQHQMAQLIATLHKQELEDTVRCQRYREAIAKDLQAARDETTRLSSRLLVFIALISSGSGTLAGLAIKFIS